MDTEFDMNNWGNVVVKLKKRYPQLTNADLIWRHETNADFYKLIAAELEMPGMNWNKSLQNYSHKTRKFQHELNEAM